jgi:hypothetical protein
LLHLRRRKSSKDSHPCKSLFMELRFWPTAQAYWITLISRHAQNIYSPCP